MSKIGRKPIDIAKNVTIELKGREVHYKGSSIVGVYALPEVLNVKHEANKLFLTLNSKAFRQELREGNRVWGLHRALLSNALQGAAAPFEKKMVIKGLGYKAVMSGKKIIFSLGYSHKMDFELPAGVAVTIDKSGQKLSLLSSNKELLGHVCSKIRSLRPPEPYKGTGIRLSTEKILLKAGKTKSA